MARAFDRFVILASMRTGSNFLEASLNALGSVACHGEAFNPHFIGKPNMTEYLGVTMAEREADPLVLLHALDAAPPGLAGFRLFDDHDPRMIAHCLADRRCAKIVLTRNPLESYVSLGVARATGQWKLGDARRRKIGLARFDLAEFHAHLDARQAFYDTIEHALQTTGQTAFRIDYDDLQDLDVLNGLAVFLGIASQLDAPVTSLRKQNPEPLRSLVENPDEMAAALSSLDPFDVDRTPDFEPRRGPAVPSYVAAAGAPLVYLPIRGGPEAAVRDWLAGVSSGSAPPGLIEGFTRPDLRRWRTAHHGARGFTVLRHPLARAHEAFTKRILAGKLGDLRRTLQQAWKIDMPPPDRLDGWAVESERAAFAGFLGFLKFNLAGQTSLRIDPSWASQAAVLQGFAQLFGPDHVLREDRLDEGLAFLAAETGATAPPVRAPQITERLAAIHSPELDSLARAAYARDFEAFGFADWHP